MVFRYPKDPSTDYIKRVIGLPGDKIQYLNKQLIINGKPLKYQSVGTYYGKGSGISMTGHLIREETLGKVKHKILLKPNLREEYVFDCMTNDQFIVPKDHYFVMGDNRDHSNDSRFWCAVPDKNLVGKAFMIWMHYDSGGDGLDISRIGNKIK